MGNNAIDQLFYAREQIQREQIKNARLEHELDKAISEIKVLSDKLEAVNKKYGFDENEYLVKCK